MKSNSSPVDYLTADDFQARAGDVVWGHGVWREQPVTLAYTKDALVGMALGKQADVSWLRFIKHPIRDDQAVQQWIAAHKAPTCWLVGTAFQHTVWQTLLDIPQGQTQSYREIAQRLGRPKAYRAAANAIGANPIAWIVPCHRVVRQSGGLGGYRWGEPSKQRLLDAEGAKT